MALGGGVDPGCVGSLDEPRQPTVETDLTACLDVDLKAATARTTYTATLTKKGGTLMMSHAAPRSRFIMIECPQ